MELFDVVKTIILLLIICGMIFVPVTLLEWKSQRIYKVEITNLEQLKLCNQEK